jgi:hypothetical protein
MKQLAHLSLLFLILAQLSCNKATFGTDTLQSISHGNTKVFSDGQIKIPIRFVQLIEDSRCPPEVQCFHMGRVIARVQIDGMVTHLGLQTTEYPSSIEFKGRTIHLMDVLYKQGQPFGTQHNAYLIVKVE